MNTDNITLEEWFSESIHVIANETCRTCKHRLRFELNSHSTKVIQCCELQPSKRSNSGYKTIKVTDKACKGYERSKHNNQRR